MILIKDNKYTAKFKTHFGNSCLKRKLLTSRTRENSFGIVLEKEDANC